MSARRKSAAWILVALLAAAVWLLWPRPAGEPRPETPTKPASPAQGPPTGLAPAPRHEPPRSDAPEASVETSAAVAPPDRARVDGGILEGEVRNAEGLPAAGAVVTALAPDEPLPPRRQGHMWDVTDAEIAQATAGQPSAVCDAAGRYEIRGVSLGTELTAAVHASDRLDGRSLPVTFSQPGERQIRDVRIPRPGHLLVKVVGWTAGASRVNQITVQGPTGWTDSFAERDLVNGQWLIEGLSPGPYTVQIFPHASPIESRVVEVVAGERTLVELAPPTGKMLDGLVVDTKGAPIAMADVWWIGAGTIMGKTDEAGRFHFEGITDEVGTLRVDALGSFGFGGFAASEQRDIEGVVPGGDPVRVVLSPAPHVVARIVGLDPSAPLQTGILSRSITSGGSPDRVGDGRIDVALTHPGVPTMLILKTAGFAPLMVELAGPYQEAKRDLGELRFDKGRKIAGVVRNETGGAVADATVLVADKWLDAERKTAADGSFSFELMPDRATEIRVNAPGYPVHIVTLPAGPAGEKPTVTVSPGGTLSIHVLDAAGVAIPAASVTFMPDGPHPYDVDYDKTRRSRTADEAGLLVVQLQARGHRITASDEAGKRHGTIGSVVVKEGETTSIELRVR